MNTKPLKSAFNRFSQFWQGLHTTQKFSFVALVVTIVALDQIAYHLLLPRPSQVLGDQDPGIGCIRTGCSGSICNPSGSEVPDTDCPNLQEYACYQEAICMVQTSGECAWSQTPELSECLTRAREDDPDAPTCTYDDQNQIVCPSYTPPICETGYQPASTGTNDCGCQLPPTCQPIATDCRPTGCSGTLCAEEDLATTCEWQAQYACYQSATCERQANGNCGWTQTEELTICLNTTTNNPTLPPLASSTPTPTPDDSGFNQESCIASDLNTDGTVDTNDRQLLIDHLFGNDSLYDINTDGTVDLADYSVMVRNWNQSCTN